MKSGRCVRLCDAVNVSSLLIVLETLPVMLLVKMMYIRASGCNALFQLKNMF